MIVATYVVFNEAELIAESIRSVKAYVDRFVFVDSAFRSHPSEATHSTDRTRQIAEAACHPLPVTYVESDRKMELDEARNLSHSLLEPGDWAFTIDGDETLLADRTEADEVVDEIRRGYLREPIRIGVYNAVLAFKGRAPAISEEQYGVLPVQYTHGVQPRLFPVAGSEWKLVPNGSSYGLYHNGSLPRGRIDRRMTIVNHRTRQLYSIYQDDYVWESELL